MLKIEIGKSADRTVSLLLPSSRTEIDQAFTAIGDAEKEMPVVIQQAQSSVPGLGERLKGIGLERQDVFRHMNYLARRTRYLTRTEQDVFSAALRMEDPKKLEEMINLSFNLDQYERIPQGTDQNELSRILLKKNKGIEVPAEIAGLLDHERVSDSFFLHHKGEFTPSGLVLKKEGAVLDEVYENGRDPDPGYEKGSLLLLCLHRKEDTPVFEYYGLSVPASEERIALARESFGVGNLNMCDFFTFHRRPEDQLIGYLPVQFQVEEINEAAVFLAEKVLDGTTERFEHLLAVLEAECPRTMEEVLEVAGNLEEYQICPEGISSPEEYVHHVLENSEEFYLDGFIEQFVDMERMAKALMAETGAVETSHGIVTSNKWRFRSFAEELVTTRFISPLEGNFHEENGWGGMEEIPSVLDGRDLMQYADSIQEYLEKEDWSNEGSRGLAEYLDNQLLKQRVVSIFPGIDEINGCLYGVATVVSRGGLNPQEMEAVMEYWSGQASDGWGEGFEQREIEVDGGKLYVSFWQSGDSFEILPEEVFLSILRESSGPQMGGM